MDTKKIKQVRELIDEMDLIKSNIDKINFLLKSCSLTTNISGHKSAFLTTRVEYVFSNNDVTKKLLNSELKKLKKKMIVCENEFLKI